MISKKTILVITTRPPLPLDGGDSVRIFNICKELSNYYNLDIIFIGNNKHKILIENTRFFNNITNIQVNVFQKIINILKFFFSESPIQLAFFYNKKLFNTVNEQSLNSDIILPHLFRSANLVKDEFNSKVIFECCDSIGLAISKIKKIDSLKKLFYKIDGKRILNFERKLLKKYKKNILISDEDLNYIDSKSIFDIRIINNGKDIESFNPDFESNYNSKKLLFIGNQRTYPNKSAVKFLLKFIKLYPEYTLVIAGKGSSLYKNIENVMVLDFYKNLYTINEIKIFAGIAPMDLGSGVQNKILDYLSLSIPCLTTTTGASGLNPLNPLLIYKNDLDLYSNLQELNKSFKTYIKVSKRGPVFLKTNHSWNKIGMDYKNYIEENN